MTFKKTSLLFSLIARAKKNNIAGKGKCIGLLSDCSRLFHAFTFDRDAASPALNFISEHKTFRGRAKHKKNAKLLTPVACALSERSE
jgi:hypothetical protein